MCIDERKKSVRATLYLKAQREGGIFPTNDNHSRVEYRVYFQISVFSKALFAAIVKAAK